MNCFTVLTAAMLSLSFGAPAFAQSASHELTRAEVRAQLVQAQAEGFVPVPKGDYPPSQQAIAHNREIYAIQHGSDAAPLANTKNPAADHPASAAN
ncbi:hypothetical protein P3T18_004776 [Paraburkholderia sp. GAS199]|uniref:DUF4148 domain-containing protein n=1 Tax=Paraburkholderia sp. GAS199 TaxID=3035126 RepID=UPI003D2314A1